MELSGSSTGDARWEGEPPKVKSTLPSQVSFLFILILKFSDPTEILIDEAKSSKPAIKISLEKEQSTEDEEASNPAGAATKSPTESNVSSEVSEDPTPPEADEEDKQKV